MIIRKGTLLFAAIVTGMAVHVPATAQSTPLQIFQETMNQLQRDLAEKQAVREAEGRIDRGESSIEEEKEKLNQSARTYEMIDQMSAQSRAIIEANRERREQRAADKQRQVEANRQAYDARVRENNEILLRGIAEGNAIRRRQAENEAERVRVINQQYAAEQQRREADFAKLQSKSSYQANRQVTQKCTSHYTGVKGTCQ